jgi:hypothetical protein
LAARLRLTRTRAQRFELEAYRQLIKLCKQCHRQGRAVPAAIFPAATAFLTG